MYRERDREMEREREAEKEGDSQREWGILISAAITQPSISQHATYSASIHLPARRQQRFCRL